MESSKIKAPKRCIIRFKPLFPAAVCPNAAARAGWNKNTTYTVIKKCIDKGAIERREPNFVCHALISKQQAQTEEAQSLVDKIFGGSAELLFASLLSDRSLSKEELDRLKALVEAHEG